MRSPLAALAALVVAVPVAAQTAADSAAVRASALDYAEGWYEGSAERMSKVFRQVVGMTPHAYRERYRHDEAGQATGTH